MRTLKIAIAVACGLITLVGVAACQAQPAPTPLVVEVTREIEATRIVEQTVEVPVTREIEATVIVERTVEVPVTVEVEATRIVELTVEVPVTVEVERMPADLCGDYPYMLRLGETWLDVDRWYYNDTRGSGWNSEARFAKQFKEMESWMTKAREAYGSNCDTRLDEELERHWIMTTWEGWAVCQAVVRELVQYDELTEEEWFDLPNSLRSVVLFMGFTYDDYCVDSNQDE